MALEASVLNHSVIRTQIKEHYDLHVDQIHMLHLGSANCYRIIADGKSYFLKEFQSGFSEADLNREVQLVNYLVSRGFPTAQILLTNVKRSCFTYRSHLVYLQDYMEGKTYGGNALPHDLLMQAAGLLGQLHTLLKDYSLPLDMSEAWLQSYSAESCAAKYDVLLNAAEQDRNDIHYERMKEDLLYKKKLAFRIAEYRKYYADITYNATHGDYTEFQFLCENGRIKAVIDFSSARTLPVVWEIMRSYVQSCGACKNGKSLDVHDFCGYVHAYLQYAPLTRADLQAMPYVYLYQLARSRYGYQQYLIEKTENKDSLLQFAFWRTDICREIERKAGLISQKLISILPE